MTTRISEGSTELQAVDEAQLLDELLIVDVPTASDRPEGTPSVVATCLGRARETIVGIEEVTLIVGVVNAEQSTAVARDTLSARRSAVLGILYGEGDVVHEIVRETFGCYAYRVVAIVCHAQLGIAEDEVLAYLLGVLCT